MLQKLPVLFVVLLFKRKSNTWSLLSLTKYVKFVLQMLGKVSGMFPLSIHKFSFPMSVISFYSKTLLVSLEKRDLFHGIKVLFPKYLQSISIIFTYHGQYFHTMELDTTLEIGFSNLFLQYFQNISILWKRSSIPFHS